MPSPDTANLRDVTISEGGFFAAFRPAAGGRISRLFHAGFGDLLVPMTDQDFAPFDWPKAGAYPLFPFHNRVIGGILHFQNRDYRMTPHPTLAPDAMHGPAHRRPWSVTMREATSLSLALDYRADADWPFDFQAEQHVSIEANRLSVTLRLTNIGDRDMPGGLGWHPYFAASSDTSVEIDARGEFAQDAKNLPTDFTPLPRMPGPLVQATGSTIHLTQWQSATVGGTKDLELAVVADSGLAHLAVHRMNTYICLEPVSHIAGALACADATARHGFATLVSGQTIESRFCVLVRAMVR